MSPILKRCLRLIPSYRLLEERKQELLRERDALRAQVTALETEKAGTAEWTRFYYPGHYYSPLPSKTDIEEAFARGGFGPPFGAIDLNEAEQLARLRRYATYYPDQPFPETPTAGRRYHLHNPSYPAFDGIMLYGMLREARPRRIIEVGSGFSSAAMLDLNDFVFDRSIEFTFIDPDMERLKKLLNEDDQARTNLIERRVQDVPLATFAALGENDVLFIDSSHVSKIGSDVNWLFFNVLPVLAPGVLIHFHDIVGNLEYPRQWLDEGRAWNEQYLLRAFLMNNKAYRIELFTSWLFNDHHPWLREHMPLCGQGGGGQIWLRKLTR
jgi:predicted O-methyltransferase YrrM